MMNVWEIPHLSWPVNHIGMHMHKPISITDSRQYMEKKNPSSMLYCYLMKASGSLNLISVTPEQFKKFWFFTLLTFSSLLPKEHPFCIGLYFMF